MTKRTITKVIRGTPVSDGDGVKLTRIIGLSALSELDPFLLLDTFQSDKPTDYIGGFPSHPHRGFETVTYLLAGRIRHKDSVGNEGVIKPGGVQWMTAGKGIIHSEMPEQINGLLHGFQLWVNLPAKEKMTSPQYQEYDAQQIPLEIRGKSQGNNVKIHLISGATSLGTQGAVSSKNDQITFYDIEMHNQCEFVEAIDNKNNTFIYLITGSVKIGDEQHRNLLNEGHLAILSQGGQVDIQNNAKYSRFLLISGKPINEPIVRNGPFVMNTQQEIEQAIHDYQTNNFI